MLRFKATYALFSPVFFRTIIVKIGQIFTFNRNNFRNPTLTIQFQGDRPMSDPGHGLPIDALDTVCKAYKDCVKCAKMEYGDMCIGEFIQYRFGYAQGDIKCRDKGNTCERALCECDAQFARDHVAKKDVFDPSFHLFWSTNDGGEMWEPKGNCPRGAGGPYEPQCCTPNDGEGPAILFNAKNRHCCPDGRVVFNPVACQQSPYAVGPN